MPRKKSKKNSRALLAVLLASAIVGAACEGGSAERQVLTAFFQAVRVRDPILLSRISVVPIDFQPNGSIQDFRVTDVESEQLTGATVKKRVTVEAQVQTSPGEIEHKTFVFTFEKREENWLIAAVR